MVNIAEEVKDPHKNHAKSDHCYSVLYHHLHACQHRTDTYQAYRASPRRHKDLSHDHTDHCYRAEPHSTFISACFTVLI